MPDPDILPERMEGSGLLVRRWLADDVESMAHARDVTLRLRDDKVTEPNQRAAFQEGIAPQVEAGLYLVPKVIE